MNITAEWLSLFVGSLVVLGGFFLWIMNMIMSPIKLIIKNNTDALGKLDEMLSKHTDRIENHEGRIIKIETVHEIEG